MENGVGVVSCARYDKRTYRSYMDKVKVMIEWEKCHC